MKRLIFAATLNLLSQNCPAEPMRDQTCFSVAETREKINLGKLCEPLHLLRIAARRWQAEAIGVKLCQRDHEMTYEIRLLPRNGRIIHLILNAQNGEIISIENQ
jgi:uncharacterized membrane protein YkoI